VQETVKCVEAADSRQGDVEDQHLRQRLLQEAKGLFGGGCLAHDSDIGATFQQLAKTGPD
jgi:hypothetical protein